MFKEQLELVLTRFGDWETDQEQLDYIDQLETVIKAANNDAAEREMLGPAADREPLISDPIYDVLMDYLGELNPDSPLLHQVWSKDDEGADFDSLLDQHLAFYPMLSIQTVKSLMDKALAKFRSLLPVSTVQMIASVKMNGHGVRVVYNQGKLVKAHSRGSRTNGRDLTEQVTRILGSTCPAFSEYGVVELRGEILLPFSRLEEARQYNPEIKSAFSGVSSMIRASASEEETQLLNFVVYDILCDQLRFDRLSDKFNYLADVGDNVGWEVPEYFVFDVNRRDVEQQLEEVVNEMDRRTLDYDYYTDGVVVAVDDIELFEEFGQEDKFRYGNLALKIGRWKQDGYYGKVVEINYEPGKTKKTPVARVEPVLTASGNTVTDVPLYAPIYILLLEAYPGNILHFKYGMEAGVVPTTPDGRIVSDKEIKLDVKGLLEKYDL